MSDRETVRALVSAFNVHNYARNTVKTNFTLQSRYEKDCIVVSFDKGMGRYQCSRYLDSIKRKIVGEFYGIEEGDTDEIVLNTANLIFNIESFPFNTSKGKWSQDEQGRIEFLAPIDKGVIFNLKSHLASSLKKDILEGMPACRIVTKASNKKDYLWHGNFDNKESCKQFKREFLSRMKARYENVPKNPLKVEGNDVYIKDVFDNARFIDSITRYKAWLVGMYLGVESSANYKVKLFKDMIIESIGQSTRVTVAGFIRNFPLNEKTAKILIPVVLDNGEPRILASEEALKLSYAFNYAVFNNLYSKVQAELPICGDSGIYGIDFSNKEISHCVITKIIKNSVINKDHELAIDPELRFRALSRSPSTELSDTEWESPTRSRGEGLEKHPRRRSKKEEETEPFRGLLGEIDPSQPTCGQLQLSLGADKGMLTEANIRDQKMTCRPSSIPFPIAWDNSISLNLGVSEDSPKDTENICNEEHKEQKVIGKSDRKSSDECSEAKSQDSKSPKKHGGGRFCKERKKLSTFKRCSVERDTMCSSKSDLVYHVTEKSSVSKLFSSFPARIRARSNPSSAVTSPTHEGASGGLKPLASDERKELRPLLSPEQQRKRDSNSFLPGKEQHLYLTHTLSGKRELSRFQYDSEQSQLLRLTKAQLPDNSSSKRDSGYSSGLPASPAVPHKESVSSGFKECEVEPVSEALRKLI
ncbi:hypothetical protein [Wolbachia endosymbiont (group A) of Cheilosia soror]|uniref:hypothetical protein n=1 Tax=Wolbachia endosymbiont (group A) of Cheilosia soror TaxID=2953995 RepID=UPI0021F85159|nr:hypothetical protein [Wolbachia endosymbiont (group A) of Cheilosia soror]